MRRTTALGAVVLICVTVVLVYWRGLGGGFLLDDHENLAPVVRYERGDTDWRPAVLDNRSGPLGRPVAMATFAANAAFGSLDAWTLKATNLAIHLVCGLLAMLLVRRVLERAHLAATPALAGALLIGAVWLLLPIHVSTVLYVIQRMAQLSALFVLVALLAYLAGRARVESAPRQAALLLFVAFPLATAAAALSKENGLLALPLAGCLELAFFTPHQGPRPRLVRAFLFAFVLLPALLGGAALLLRPETVLASYAERSFTLGERLLTEPRVLLDYARAVLLPYSPALGLLHDNYPKSTGLLAPPATLVAILTWTAALVLAWRVRTRYPLILGGLLFYLAAHALEGSVIALELYFEHRNYLASLGLLLAAAGVVVAIAQHLPPPSAAMRGALPIGALLLPLAFATATHARAAVWSSVDALYAQSLEHNPGSPRLRSMLSVRAMQSGDLATALGHIDAAERADRSGAPARYALWRLLAYCETRTAPPAALALRVAEAAPERIAQGDMVAFELVTTRAETGDCPGLDVDALADGAQRWLERTAQAPRAHAVWRVRYNTARLLASRSRWPEAIAEAERAWADSADNRGVGVLVFQLHASVGDLEACRRVHARLQALVDGSDHAFERAVAAFGRFVASGGKSSPDADEALPDVQAVDGVPPGDSGGDDLP